jgi:heptosyltransferase III
MKKIDKILFVTMSNIGDVVMSLPTLDLLRQRFPAARITVVASPRMQGLFAGNPLVTAFVPFDKRAPLSEKLKYFDTLRRERFDLVIDLRNSLVGRLLGRIRQPLFLRTFPPGTPSWKRHRARAEFLLRAGEQLPESRDFFFVPQADKDYVEGLLRQSGFGEGVRPVVICPGALSRTKCWSKENFAGLAKELAKESCPLLIIGASDDRELTAYIRREAPAAVDIAGRTNLLQLVYLLTKASVFIGNDSGVMHLASYLDTPVVALFGPSDELEYGPWSSHARAVTKPVSCRPCMNAQCRYPSVRCLTSISIAEVKTAVLQLLRESAEKS